jgi:hypothetical protein
MNFSTALNAANESSSLITDAMNGLANKLFPPAGDGYAGEITDWKVRVFKKPNPNDGGIVREYPVISYAFKCLSGPDPSSVGKMFKNQLWLSPNAEGKCYDAIDFVLLAQAILGKDGLKSLASDEVAAAKTVGESAVGFRFSFNVVPPTAQRLAKAPNATDNFKFVAKLEG